MASQIQEVVEKMSSSFSGVFSDVQKMKSKKLTPSEMYSFSRRALRTRSLTLEENFSSRAEEILSVQRPEDEGDDLWRVYNRIQENLMMGNFEVKTKKGPRKGPSIRSIDRGIKINEALWNLAKSYLSE